jgi:hypothetical protein
MRMMKVSAAAGSRVPNFESHAQGVPAWLEPGDVYDVPDASHWRKALKAGDVKAECPAARKYAPAPSAPSKPSVAKAAS